MCPRNQKCYFHKKKRCRAAHYIIMNCIPHELSQLLQMLMNGNVKLQVTGFAIFLVTFNKPCYTTLGIRVLFLHRVSRVFD